MRPHRKVGQLLAGNQPDHDTVFVVWADSTCSVNDSDFPVTVPAPLSLGGHVELFNTRLQYLTCGAVWRFPITRRRRRLVDVIENDSKKYSVRRLAAAKAASIRL